MYFGKYMYIIDDHISLICYNDISYRYLFAGSKVADPNQVGDSTEDIVDDLQVVWDLIFVRAHLNNRCQIAHYCHCCFRTYSSLLISYIKVKRIMNI